jgi:penicillin-binding protein 1C
VVLASDGSILTAYLTVDGAWRLRTEPKDVAPAYLRMLLAFEDRRFFRHGGFDIWAIGRAVAQAVANGRIVSGASTITMQVVRLLDGQRSGLFGKIRQIALASKLERSLDKDEILSLYLTVAPFGGNIEGVRMASLQYFGKEPSELTIGEAATLVALPQAPESRRPDLLQSQARPARDRVLSRMLRASILPAATIQRALKEPAPSSRGRYRFLAHHLSDRLRAGSGNADPIHTLIDRELQIRVEKLVAHYATDQPDPANAAVIVVRNNDTGVRAYVGGWSYFDRYRAGMLDLAQRVRSPGSVLKPVIYGLAFEELLVHPETIVSDEPIAIGGYSPENFDKKFRGDLTIREALQNSVNTTPVVLLDHIGPEKFVGRLSEAGIEVELPGQREEPGLAVALGGVGITLEKLATLFAGLANGGVVRPLRFAAAASIGKGIPLLSQEAAWAVKDILADMPPPPGRHRIVTQDGGRRVAYKTGTSYGFRDAWAVGFDTDATVAVWVGRPDGLGRPGHTGANDAVPLMTGIFDLLPLPDRDVAFDRPTEGILTQIGDLPGRLQRYPATLRTSGTAHRSALSIRFPADGSTVTLARGADTIAPMMISATGGYPPFHWFLDGLDEQETLVPEIEWTPPGSGQFDISVVDSAGAAASSSVWLQ